MEHYTSVKSGTKAVSAAGTAVVLSSDAGCQKVDITAMTTNSDYVVIGGSDVVAATATRKGIPLLAGQSITIYINNLNQVYVDALVNGEGVTFVYYD